MFATRFFPVRYFAGRYWPKVGVTVPLVTLTALHQIALPALMRQAVSPAPSRAASLVVIARHHVME